MGRRINKNITNTSLSFNISNDYFYYDDNEVIEEYSANDTLLRAYVLSEVLDGPVLMTEGGIDFFYHFNGQGSVVGLSDSSGALVEKYKYDSFGNLEIITDSNLLNNPYFYSSRRYVNESDLYYFRARYYDPAHGVFIQRDPMGYKDSSNLYSYVAGNPVNYIDPFGLEITDQYGETVESREIFNVLTDYKTYVRKSNDARYAHVPNLAKKLLSRFFDDKDEIHNDPIFALRMLLKISNINGKKFNQKAWDDHFKKVGRYSSTPYANAWEAFGIAGHNAKGYVKEWTKAQAEFFVAEVTGVGAAKLVSIAYKAYKLRRAAKAANKVSKKLDNYDNWGGEYVDDVIRKSDDVLPKFKEGAGRLIGANKAKIDPRKLTEYALNPNHPVGKNKAKVFDSALGFNRSNSDDLLRQLQDGVLNTTPVPGKSDKYGIRFTLDIMVKGPKGNGTVRTGWIFKTGSKVPEMTTLWVK